MIRFHQIPIFTHQLVVVVNDSQDKMNNELRRYCKDHDYTITCWDGLTELLSGNVVAISIFPDVLDSVVYHESAHAAFLILGNIGEFPDYGHQETFCYLQGFIANLVNEDRRKFKSKASDSL